MSPNPATPPSGSTTPTIPATDTQQLGGTPGVTSRVHPREEEYAFVTPGDLHEVADFGMMEYLLSQVGGFFFSGALWQAVTIMSAQAKFAVTPWLFSCFVSMAFGIVLLICGFVMFRMRQNKAKKYFPKPLS